MFKESSSDKILSYESQHYLREIIRSLNKLYDINHFTDCSEFDDLISKLNSSCDELDITNQRLNGIIDED